MPPEPSLPPPDAPPSRRRSAWAFVLSLLALLVLVDLLLAASAAPVARTLEGAEDLDALLGELAGSAPETEPWLMLGDSVLVGDTGAAELPRWSEHRLVDYMRRELAADEAARFEQVGLAGMLPVDMRAIAEQLDARDPEGRVALLVQLSPRHFSPAYAGDESHSRPWLAELGDDADGLSVSSLRRRLRRVTPIVRHRARFAGLRERLAGPSAQLDAGPDPDRERDERVQAFARLSVHYREPVLSPESAQVEALVELAARCRARGRRLVLFSTPVEDRFVAKLGPSADPGELLARLDALVQPDGREVALLPMDHPMFASGMFWDHVHLRPEGHRLLAINLLAELGLGLARVPTRQELIGRPGIDASLVAGVERGAAVGAAWQARFDGPRGLAVAPGGGEVVIADTNNHVLRWLHGDLRVVSTLAGVAGEAGEADGSIVEARLDRPRTPMILGDAVVFADGDGARLRRVEAGVVETLARLDEGWQITKLREHADRLYTLERSGGATRIVRRELTGAGATALIHGAETPAAQLVAFTFDPAGELYFATADGRIHACALADLADPLELGDQQRARLVFTNEAPLSAVIPPNGVFFPLPFADLRLSEIRELVYVERYGGLLVQDLTPHRRGSYANAVTERAHLRFLDLERQLIFPWLKPLAVGAGYAYLNENSAGLSSYFHEGALALDQRTATLFYLETHRSRLLRLEDGMLGLAKIGTFAKTRLGSYDVLGNGAGQRALSDHEPMRFVTEPLAGDPAMDLRGPYEILLIGSSMTSMSEVIGDYSLGRQLIAKLERELALRDRLRVHGFQRTVPGGRLTRDIPVLKRYLRVGGRPDLILIDANGSTFMPEDADDAFMDEQLERMTKLAQRWDSKLVFFDTAPYIVRNREPPRPTLARVERFLQLAEIRGFDVVRVDAQVLDANLEVAPMANPPVKGIHAPPWAIDLLAEEFAAAIAPIARAWLRDRRPARLALAPQSPEDARALQLAEAFAEVEHDWDAALPELAAEAVQFDSGGSELVAFVDLARLPEHDGAEPDLEALILAVIHEHAVRLRDGSRRAQISVGRFERYDEYGAGVAEGATILIRKRLDYEGLVALAEAFAGR